MDVTLLYFDGCPNWRDTEEKVLQALERLGLPAGSVALRRVDSTEEAELLSFQGSPTVLINGIDPVAEPDAPVGLMCRVYRAEGGIAGSPTLQGLVKALTSLRCRVPRGRIFSKPSQERRSDFITGGEAVRNKPIEGG